ncbi:MAG: ImmA/IrrE family metallo-endopeptidase [Roseivirga sp.]|nr:ImmA/IrrE family metallo-endopeptidase [Roseivirga sp.]
MKGVKSISEFNSPGQAIKELLDQRGWTQEELAEIVSRSLKHLNEIIQNKRPVTQEFADLFASTFLDREGGYVSTSDAWLELSRKHHGTSSQANPKDDPIRRKAQIYRYIPVKELIKKNWLKATDDLSNLENQLKKFLGQPTDKPLDLSFLDRNVRSMNFRKSDAHGPASEYSAQIWKHRVVNHISKQKKVEYNEVAFRALLENAHYYTVRPNGVKLFLKEMEDTGVSFAFLPHLSKTYLDGAAFADGDRPIIALSGRFDRIDNFWFTLLHESHHVLVDVFSESNDENEEFFDDSNVDPLTEKKEKAANEFAARLLLEKEIIEYFGRDVHYMPEGKIRLFAEYKSVHASIVVGVLAHKKMIPWTRMHRYKEPVRNKIPKKYLA